MVLEWKTINGYYGFKLINNKTNEVIYTIQTVSIYDNEHILFKGDIFYYSYLQVQNDLLKEFIIKKYFNINIDKIKTYILRKYKIEKILK